jgi:hypothetical protein
LTRCLVRAAALFAAVCLYSPSAGAQAPAEPTAPPNELDAFMEKVLKRRDLNRQVLEQYVLDEDEQFEVLGPGRIPVFRQKREFAWYVRDGLHVRSPVRFDGVSVGEDQRKQYEDAWSKRERARLESEKKKAEKEKNKEADKDTGKETTEPEKAADPIDDPTGIAAASPVPTPRFVSESYFMDFKFEPGNYYLAGKETIDGQSVLKIDYLPTRLFNDNDEERRHARESSNEPKREEPRRDTRSEKQRQKDKEFEAEIDRKMNKSSQVTLWVDPASHQIVKYTFDNVWLDFLPAGWIVRIDDLRASMQMGQPFPGVWLPRDVSIHAGVTLALGSMELQYKRAFSKYRKADVSSKVSVPKDGR